jgi:hypothetical protein
MAFKLEIGGVPVAFKDRKEALAFVRDMAQEPTQDAPKGRKPASVGPSGFLLAKTAYDFLVALREGGEKGVDTKRVTKVLGISDPKAIGNRGRLINRYLSVLGFEPKAVYTNDRNSEGKREWKLGQLGNDAIAALSKSKA